MPAVVLSTGDNGGSMDHDGVSVMAIIKSGYEQMSSAERKVADCVLESPDAALNMNVSELAQSSGVSDATVVRMCHRLGYKGYYQLRLMMARDLGSEGESQPEDDGGNPVQNIFNRYAATLQLIGNNMDPALMTKCAGLIESANMIHAIGVGNTNHLAQYLEFRLQRLGTRCIADRSPEYFLGQINLGTPDDLVIAISKSGMSRSVIQAAEMGHRKGMKVIAITAYQLSPLSELADFVLISAGRKESFSYYKEYAQLNEMAVIDALLESVLDWDKIHRSGAEELEEILADNKY